MCPCPPPALPPPLCFSGPGGPPPRLPPPPPLPPPFPCAKAEPASTIAIAKTEMNLFNIRSVRISLLLARKTTKDRSLLCPYLCNHRSAQEKGQGLVRKEM